MITKRVADALAELNVKSYTLESMLKREEMPFAMNGGYSVGALSSFLPEDLAIKYGEPLSLECKRGCWPDVESILSSHQRIADEDAGGREDAWCTAAGSGVSDRFVGSCGLERQATIAEL